MRKKEIARTEAVKMMFAIGTLVPVAKFTIVVFGGAIVIATALLTLIPF